MTTVDRVTGEIIEEPEGNPVTYQAAVGALAEYLNGRNEEQTGKRYKDTAGKLLRAYLEANPGEEIRDGEKGITGKMQHRSGLDLDVLSLAAKNPELLMWAATHGLLKLNTATYKALQGQGQEMVELKGWIAPTGTDALVVTKEKN